MAAKLELTIQVEKQSLAEALKKIEVDEMMGVLYSLAAFYVASGHPDQDAPGGRYGGCDENGPARMDCGEPQGQIGLLHAHQQQRARRQGPTGS